MDGSMKNIRNKGKDLCSRQPLVTWSSSLSSWYNQEALSTMWSVLELAASSQT